MKKLLAILALLVFTANPAEAVEKNGSVGSLTLSGGKVVNVISYNELQIPPELNYGRTFQLLYETKIPTTDTENLKIEAREVLNILLTKIPASEFKTVYIRANGIYTGKMLTSKNGEDFKFVKGSGGEWKLK